MEAKKNDVVGYTLIPIMPINFCPENIVCILSSTAYIQIRQVLIMEENIMNPDQTAPCLDWVHIVCNIGFQSV